MKKLTRTIVFLLCLAGLARAADRPNIIVLVADDLRWDTFGWAGHPVVKTPNIDRLAADGVRFTNNFCTTSICSISRASIFSGQYESRHGIDDFAKNFSPEAWRRTYPALLRAHGYHTGFIGKFGVGNQMPQDQFDYWKGFPGQGNYLGKDKHLTAIMGDQAVEFIRMQRGTQPFCLSVSFKAPHADDGKPREFPPDPQDEELYANITIPPPRLADSNYFAALPEFLRQSENRTRWERRFATPEMYQKTCKDYFRLVTGMDREIGRIMEALRDTRLDSNTLIIFTSDNGFFLGERGFAGKWLMFEESIRTPLIIRPPKPSTAPLTVNAMVLNIDLAPTILDYAKIEIPSAMQGKSLRPWLQGKTAPWRKEFFYEHHFIFGDKIPPVEGIRAERWKYVRYVRNGGVEEFYDLFLDPYEEKNLASNPKYESRLRDFRKKWEKMREQLK